MKTLRSLASRVKRRLRPPQTDATGVWARHFFQDLEHYAIEGFIYGRGLLVISFEHAAGDDQANAYRHGWGARIFRHRQISHLCIKPKAQHWYLQPGLPEALTALRDSGFLGKFKRRMTYGSSMGGFAALVFADLLQADTVLALSPQTTLDPAKVPWEHRFKQARNQDWTGPNSDAVGRSIKVRDVCVVYDPHDPGDMAHIDRLDQNNLVHIRAPYLGHGIGAPLGQLGYLDPLLRMVLRDELDLIRIADKLRNRRSLPRYYDLMLKKPRVAGSPLFTRIVTEAQARHTDS